MEFKAYLEEKISKTGNPYKCIILKLSDKVEKMIFLTPSELELLELKMQKDSNKDTSTSFNF